MLQDLAYCSRIIEIDNPCGFMNNGLMDWMYLLIFLGGSVAGFGIAWLFLMSGKLDETAWGQDRTLGEAVTALADGDRDKAQKILTNVVAQNTEELDAYLTLGILYRQKGWFHRAVDIHRRLLSRPMLDAGRKRCAMVALALDFEEAGLVDRAVNAMQQVLDRKNPISEDFEIVARLYETTEDWTEASDAWDKAGSDDRFRRNLAFTRTLEGVRKLQGNEPKLAIKAFQSALKIDKTNPAALLHLAEHYAKRGKLKLAVQYYEALQQARVDLTGVIADSLESIIRDTNNEGLKAFYLELMKSQAHKPRVAVRFASWLNEMGDIAQALRILTAIDPTNLAPELRLRLVETAESVGEFELASNVARSTLSTVINKDRFVCHACGESMPILEWRCPKCREWGTVRSRTMYAMESEGERIK